MRILVVTQYFWPENFRINDLVEELVSRDHEVTVLTGKPNYPSGKVFQEYKDNPEQFDHFNDVGVYRAPMIPRGKGAVRLIVNYISYVIGACIKGPWSLRKKDFDVIFVYEPSPITVGLPAVLMGKIKSAPVVFWTLDLWPETLSAIGVVRSQRILKYIGYIVSFIYNRCELVLGQSKGFIPSIQKYCKKKSIVRYFPSWSEEVFLENVSLASEVEQKDGVFDILFAGNVGEAQDMPAVLRAAELLSTNKKIRWLIVGDGRMSAWLESEVEKRDLAEQVLLLGRYPIERMPSFYLHADALLVSLKQDPVFKVTIPAKVQSYLTSGIPLLGMLDGEGAEIIRQSGAGYVCAAGDSKGLSEIAIRLSGLNDNQRKEMGRKGREFADTEFKRSKLICDLEEYFDEAIKSYNE